MDLLALTWQVEAHLSFAHTARLSIGEHHLWHIRDDIFGSEVTATLGNQSLKYLNTLSP